MKKSFWAAVSAITVISAGAATPSFGVEGAAGFYLLGSKTTMAGFLPPPGTYVQELNYFYGGSTGSELSIAGLTISGGVDATVYYTLPTAQWVAPGSVLGGNFALSATTPIGWKDVSAGVSLTGPNGNVISRNISDVDAAFGDPVLGATLGWHQGNYHWNFGTLLNVPIGFWKKGNLANIGFGRWAADFTGALTYLEMTTGVELSGAAGFTINGENPDTDYKSGTEFHLELGAMQNFSKTFALGVGAYYYDQVTGDSGAGAVLGPFEGRVFGIGPAANLTFMLGQIPVSTNLKYFHEFAAVNRLEGSAGYVTLTMPLSVVGH